MDTYSPAGAERLTDSSGHTQDPAEAPCRPEATGPMAEVRRIQALLNDAEMRRNGRGIIVRRQVNGRDPLQGVGNALDRLEVPWTVSTIESVGTAEEATQENRIDMEALHRASRDPGLPHADRIALESLYNWLNKKVPAPDRPRV